MSTAQGATQALETRLATAFPALAIAWPNVEFVAPTGALWLKPSVLWAAGALLSMAPERLNRAPGLYQVSIYSPQSLGAGAALALADQVRGLYSRAVFDGVRCDVPSGPVVLPEEPPWYGVAVTIPFDVIEET